MNEQQFALQVRRVLDESVERLPYRVSHRLEAARRGALTRMPREGASPAHTRKTAPSSASAGPVAQAPALHARTAGSSATGTSAAPGTVVALAPAVALPLAGARTTRSLWLRVGILLVPLVLVALGLIGISAWHELDVADETAEVDLAVLTDDIPISAYADRGFGVFLKNSQQ